MADLEEYNEWYARMDIISVIIEKNYEEVLEKLDAYRENFWIGGTERLS